MNGHEYEMKCARYLTAQGFRHVELTKQSSDQGIDLLASRHGVKYAIQCKYYTGAVGNHAVMEAFSGAKYYGCHRAMVITNSTFTAAAEKMALQTGVVLWPGCNARTGFLGQLTPAVRKLTWLLALICAALVGISLLRQGNFPDMGKPHAMLLTAVATGFLLRICVGRSRLSIFAAAGLEAWATYLLIQNPLQPPEPFLSEHVYLVSAAAAFFLFIQFFCQMCLSSMPKSVRAKL